MKQLSFWGAFAFIAAVAAAPVPAAAQKTASPNNISFAVANGRVYPIEGASEQLTGEAGFDDTTFALQQLSFIVPLQSFYGANAGYLSWLGNGWYYPDLSFKSRSVTVREKSLEIRGDLNFRGRSAPAVLYATRTDDDRTVSLNGSFTLMTSDYFIFMPPPFTAPATIPFRFNLAFDKPRAAAS